MVCFKCGGQMRNVLHFETGREFQFNYCSKCNERTKHKRLHYDDIGCDKKVNYEKKR